MLCKNNKGRWNRMKMLVMLCQEGTYAEFLFECYTGASREDGLRRERSAERFIKKPYNQ